MLLQHESAPLVVAMMGVRVDAAVLAAGAVVAARMAAGEASGAVLTHTEC